MRNLRANFFLVLFLLLMPFHALATNDVQAPIVTDVSIDKQGQTVQIGDTVTVRMHLTDETGIDKAVVCFKSDPGNLSNYVWLSYNVNSGFYEGTWEIPELIVNGKHSVKYISVDDTIGNSNYLDTYSDVYFYLTPANHVWIDGDIGIAGDQVITGLEAGKKYLIAFETNNDYYRQVYYVNADGTVGQPFQEPITYENLPLLNTTSIIGLTNGRHYQVIECQGNEGRGDAYIEYMPNNTNLDFLIFDVSPASAMYATMAGITSHAGQLLNVIDIIASDALPPEGIFISFYVGWRYAGRNVTIYHLGKNGLDTFHTSVDESGIATIRVYSLSPFAVVLNSETETDINNVLPPKTGDNASIELWIVSMLFSVATILVTIRYSKSKLR